MIFRGGVEGASTAAERDLQGDPQVNLCTECVHYLRDLKKVPPGSLVRVDTGQLPRGSNIPRSPDGQDADYQLEPLSMFEERLLGIKQASRLVTVMRCSGGDSTLQQWRWRGHVIAFQNVDIEDVAKCLPLPFDSIPTHMQVR